MHDQSDKHDMLNETLEELERSLEEISGSNKLLRDTLHHSNDFIQTHVLHSPMETYPVPSKSYTHHR